MSAVADDWARAAEGFTARADAVTPDAWDNPAPCEGWVARDIVRHLIEWVPPFLDDAAGLHVASVADASSDPAGAWRELARAVQALLDDPAVSAGNFDHPRAGRHTVSEAIATFVLPDVLIHTWDLARATGQDETLDPDLVHQLLTGMAGIDQEMLVASGQYAPRVRVADDADEQTRLIAFTGRRP